MARRALDAVTVTLFACLQYIARAPGQTVVFRECMLSRFASSLRLTADVLRCSHTLRVGCNLRVTTADHVNHNATRRVSGSSRVPLEVQRPTTLPFASSQLGQPAIPTTASRALLSGRMSSDEEVFDLDVSGSESEDYAPAPKKKAAPKKAASKPASKPAAKPAGKASKTTTKKKNLADKENDASEVESDGDDDRAPGPSIPAPTKKKTASETYQKVRIWRNCVVVYSFIQILLTTS